MKSKKIISLALALTLCISTFGTFGTISYAAPGGEETWNCEKMSSGLNTPFAPSDKYVSEQNAPDFTWPCVIGAQKYDLIVCSDESLKDIKYSAYDVENNFYTFPNTFETGVYYYWAVRYYDGSAYSAWSNARRFKIRPNAYEFTYPGADEVMKNVPTGHPRIYATQQTLEEVRSWKDKNEQSKKCYDSIVNTARAYLTTRDIPAEPVKETSDDAAVDAVLSQKLVSDANKLINQILNCGYAYMLTGDEEVGRFGVECLLAISGWDINGDTSYKSQDQVHRAIAYRGAIGYDMLYDLMTEAERKTVLDMIVARTKVMEYLLDSLTVSSYDSHGWTAYGYIGIISLALYGDVPEAADWMRRVLDGYVSLLTPWTYQDGGWSQGTDYWQYSSEFEKEFTEVIALANVFDFHQKAYARNEYLWLLYAYPPGSYGSFGDQSNRNKSSAASASIAGRRLAFNRDNGVLKWLYDQWPKLGGIAGYYVAAMISDIEAEAPIAYPLAHEFHDIGWTVMTNDLVDPNRIQCTFKSSHYGSYNHSHPDQNSFIIQAYGENLAIKSGYYDGYHTPHDSGFTRKTGAHNSVTVANSKGQQDDNFLAKGKLTGFLNHVDFDLSAGDATTAYMGGLDKFERNMIYIRPDMFIVIDDLDAKDKGKSKFEWWLNAEHDIKTYEDCAGARLQEGSAVLDAKVQYPENCKTFYNNTFALSDMVEVPASGNYTDANVQRRVWFQTPSVSRTKMVVTMDVHKDDVEARYVDTQTFDDYLKMTFTDGTVVLVNLQEDGKTVTTKDGISFDGVAVTYNDESIMLAQGTFLKWGETELIRCENEASVVMGKDELGISSYTDQKVSVNTNNDYINGIESVTDYEGHEISSEWGITMEQGMLAPTGETAKKETKTQTATPVKQIRTRWDIGIPVATKTEKVVAVEETAEDTEKLVYAVDAEADGVTFDLDMDNYTLMLNGKLVKTGSLSGNIKVKIKASSGDREEDYALTGYMRRDGTQNYSGKIELDGMKYTLKSIDDGVDFGGLKVGDTKGLTAIDVSSVSENATVVLEKVDIAEFPVNSTEDHEGVKSAATVFIEAEDAVSFESGNKYDTRAFMSGGAGVTNHNTEGTSLGYEVEIPEDGDYELSMKYVAWLDGGAIRAVSIDGKVFNIPLPKTESWGADPGDWRAVVSQNTINLKAGKYTMYIEAVLGSWNLDWIAFTKK